MSERTPVFEAPPDPRTAWAKSRKTDSGRIPCLSLTDHSVDVAAMAEALLHSPTIRRRLGTLAGHPKFCLTDPDCTRLAFFAGMHDAGKVNRGFQGKLRGLSKHGDHIGPIWKLLGSSELWGADRDLCRKLRKALGAVRWSSWFEDRDAERALWNMVLAHHGYLPSSDQPSAAPDEWTVEACDGYRPLAAIEDLRDTLGEMFPETQTDTREVLPTTPRFLHAMAGLVILADWLGSDETVFRFPASGAPSGRERIDWARKKAKNLVRRRWLDPSGVRDAAKRLVLDFAELFPELYEPRPAQQELLTVPLPKPGQISILEAETGSGKTEAALIHFLRLFRAEQVDGLYFALPTRAAAVQIHGRIRETLGRWLGEAAPPVGLAVPGYLRVDDHDGQPLPENRGQLWPDDADRDRIWAVENSKRYLSGAVMVGTIDQILLGVLRVRHAQLRSGPMLRLLLCVDEVHASDAYMTTLLRRLLDQHAHAEGHALLMSATLGTLARKRLLRPSGVERGEKPGVGEAARIPYPAMHRSGELMRKIVHDRSEKRVQTELLDPETVSDALFRRIKEAADGGAVVLFLRNTVRDARRAFAELEAIGTRLLVCEGVAAPHHSRFAPEDRRLLDAALERAFRDTDREGVVAVTTQTAEQSLDICADWLITDLAPGDVLLQRVGRLHRHPNRHRPAGFECPRVTVLAPDEARLAAGFDDLGCIRSGRRPLLGLGSVYGNVVGVLATRNWLNRHPQEIRIPADNRALVEAATNEAHLRGYASSLGGVWPKHLDSVTGERLGEAGVAIDAAIDWEKSLIDNRPPRNLSALTRLGMRDRLADFAIPQPGPFGHPVSRIRIPGWMVKEVPDEDAELKVLETSQGRIRFRFGGVLFEYDRLGLICVC